MNLPSKFESRMREMLKTEYDVFVSSFTEGDPAEGVRLNPLKSALRPDFLTDSVPWCENGYYISKKEISGNHPYHLGGLLYFQEPSAMPWLTVEQNIAFGMEIKGWSKERIKEQTDKIITLIIQMAVDILQQTANAFQRKRGAQHIDDQDAT